MEISNMSRNKNLLLYYELKTIGKEKERIQPIVDAAKQMITFVFVPEGLGQPELKVHNRRQVLLRDRVKSTFGPIIGGINQYLHAYQMYRTEAMRLPEIDRLNTLGRNALETLQRVSPYCVTIKKGVFPYRFCTERPHSMVHWQHSDHLHHFDAGPDKVGSQDQRAQTNNQNSFGGSLLKNRMGF
jgi:hypothetical protein